MLNKYKMRKKSKLFAAIFCVIYYFFPVVQYIIVFNSATIDDKYRFEDYHFFTISSVIFGFVRLVNNSMFSAFFVQLIACFLSWLILWPILYSILKIIFKLK